LPAKRGVSNVEYIVIVAAVLIIILVASVFLRGVPEAALESKVQHSTDYWTRQAAPLRIVEHAGGSGIFAGVLENTERDVLRVEGAEFDGHEMQIANPNTQAEDGILIFNIAGGSRQKIVLLYPEGFNPCANANSYEHKVKITYWNMNNPNPTPLVEEGAINLFGKCSAPDTGCTPCQTSATETVLCCPPLTCMGDGGNGHNRCIPFCIGNGCEPQYGENCNTCETDCPNPDPTCSSCDQNTGDWENPNDENSLCNENTPCCPSTLYCDIPSLEDDGTCQQCISLGSTCDQASQHCCAGYTCHDQRRICCVANGAPGCITDANCCDPVNDECVGGFCRERVWPYDIEYDLEIVLDSPLPSEIPVGTGITQTWSIRNNGPEISPSSSDFAAACSGIAPLTWPDGAQIACAGAPRCNFPIYPQRGATLFIERDLPADTYGYVSGGPTPSSIVAGASDPQGPFQMSCGATPGDVVGEFIGIIPCDRLVETDYLNNYLFASVLCCSAAGGSCPNGDGDCCAGNVCAAGGTCQPDVPDLVASAFRWPNLPVPTSLTGVSTSFILQGITSNIGGGQAGASFTRYNLSNGLRYNNNPPGFPAGHGVPALDPDGQYYNEQLDPIITCALQDSSTQTIIIEADFQNAVVESNELNNNDSVYSIICLAPDLTAYVGDGSIYHNPRNPLLGPIIASGPGSQFTIDAATLNAGPGDAPASTTYVQYGYEPNPEPPVFSTSISVPALAVGFANGQNLVLACPMAYPPGSNGYIDVYLTADGNSQIPESDDGNNMYGFFPVQCCKSETATCPNGNECCPGLTCSGGTCQPNQPDLVATLPNPPGQAQTVNSAFNLVVRTSNLGYVTAPASITLVNSISGGITFDSQASRSISIGQLGAGQSAVPDTTVTVLCTTPGSKTIRANADNANVVQNEITETNNIATFDVTCCSAAGGSCPNGASDCCSGYSCDATNTCQCDGVAEPTGLTATPVYIVGGGYLRINLQWLDNSADEINYIIMRKNLDLPQSQFITIATLPPNSNSYTDNAAGEDSYYAYRVIAYESSACQRSADINAVSLLYPPDVYGCWGLGGGQIRCEWTPVSTRATFYRVERCSAPFIPNGGCYPPGATNFDTTNNGYYVDAAAGDAMWYYRIKAMNGRTNSYDTSVWHGTTSYDPAGGKHFFTVGPHNGDFDTNDDGNGMPEADAYCDSQKPSAANRGPYKAWLQPSVTDAAHLLSPSTRYVWMNNAQGKRASFLTTSGGAPVHQMWNTQPTIGAIAPGYIWTNLNDGANGAASGPILTSCASWSTAQPPGGGQQPCGGIGTFFYGTSRWSWWASYPSCDWTRSCIAQNYIYCFEP
jgi:hypothetical protein